MKIISTRKLAGGYDLILPEKPYKGKDVHLDLP